VSDLQEKRKDESPDLKKLNPELAETTADSWGRLHGGYVVRVVFLCRSTEELHTKIILLACEVKFSVSLCRRLLTSHIQLALA